MKIVCNIFICLSLISLFSYNFYVFVSFFVSSSFHSDPITSLFFCCESNKNPTSTTIWTTKKKLFLIASPMQIKLATVIKNTRFIRANESIPETKEINHKFDEERNSSSYSISTGNNSTFETSTSILVSQIGNKMSVYIWEYFSTWMK